MLKVTSILPLVEPNVSILLYSTQSSYWVQPNPLLVYTTTSFNLPLAIGSILCLLARSPCTSCYYPYYH